jgi:hypothetical protein
MVTESVIINRFLANFAIWEHYSTAFSGKQRKAAEEFRENTLPFLDDHRILWINRLFLPIFLSASGKSGLLSQSA